MRVRFFGEGFPRLFGQAIGWPLDVVWGAGSGEGERFRCEILAICAVLQVVA